MDSCGALADATRRHIVELLGRGEHAAGAIARNFAVSAPAVSQHLKVLRKARLVRVRVAGQHRIYSLDPAGLGEIDAWLQQVRRFWGDRLDALALALRKPDKTQSTTRKKRSKG